MSTTSHPSPTEHFLNRELSLLAFNERVLAMAEDPAVPALERLRYICIVSSNLDELFEIRVSGIKAQLRSHPDQVHADGFTAATTYTAVCARAGELIDRQYQVLNEQVFPLLQQHGIHFHLAPTLDDAQREWAHHYFSQEVLPVLTPIGLSPTHPFPRVLNKSLNFIVELQGEDSFGRQSGVAIVQAPRALPRLVALPKAISGYPHGFMMLSSFVQSFVHELFPGMTAIGVHQFRVTRNSDLFVDDEEVTDLREALQGELSQRQFGDAVRLEVSEGISDRMLKLLRNEFGLTDADCYRVHGPVNMVRLMQLPDLVDRPDLKFPAFTPRYPKALESANLFEVIRQQDVLLHHPYDSFSAVADFIRLAAADPQVVAIKQTIYRTGQTSELMESLLGAVRAGKEVRHCGADGTV